LRQQVQQLQQELAAAQQGTQAARAEADQRTASAQAEASRARRSASGTAQRVKELEAELDTLRSEQSAQQARQAELTQQLERAQGQLRSTRNELGARDLRLSRRESELESLEARFRSQNGALDLCTRHNQTLRGVSLDLLGRWQRMDWRDALAAKEPFVQTERVRIENLVQGYEEQIDRATLARPAAAGASGPAPRP
jgi:chromosome segregation ATPase